MFVVAYFFVLMFKCVVRMCGLATSLLYAARLPGARHKKLHFSFWSLYQALHGKEGDLQSRESVITTLQWVWSYSEVQALVQISWVSDWLSARFFSMCQLSSGGCKRNKILHKRSLEDEDDARISNTRTAQRKRTVPYSTMKNHHNITDCCNNTHQGRHVPATKWYVHTYIELHGCSYWPVQCHTVYTKYAHGMENWPATFCFCEFKMFMLVD